MLHIKRFAIDSGVIVLPAWEGCPRYRCFALPASGHLGSKCSNRFLWVMFMTHLFCHLSHQSNLNLRGCTSFNFGRPAARHDWRIGRSSWQMVSSDFGSVQMVPFFGVKNCDWKIYNGVPYSLGCMKVTTGDKIYDYICLKIICLQDLQ